MDDELFQTFDSRGHPLALVSRSRVHREGLWHRAASVFLFRPDGKLVIQQRHASKDVCPGAWDLSVAEHLAAGETFAQGAMRGLREELGVEQVDLEPFGGEVRVTLDLPALNLRDYEIQQAFRAVYDGELNPNPDEVAAIDAVAATALCAAFIARPDAFTPWFRESATRLGLCSPLARDGSR
jgi:isopentenyl-diphosphate delta-isomerase